jgi:hypothetical protein
MFDLYFYYWMRFAFLNSRFLFSLDISKAQHFVDRLHSGCTSSPGLHPIFGRFSQGQYRDFAFLGHLRDRTAPDMK